MKRALLWVCLSVCWTTALVAQEQEPVPEAGRLFDGLKEAMERLREDRPSPPLGMSQGQTAVDPQQEAAVRRIVADELSKVNWTGQGSDPDHFSYTNRARERRYGEGQETVVCVPRHVCVILFEQGEVIVGAVIGDDASWPLESEYAGVPGREFPVIALTPQEFGARSNLVVLTDRRTYRFELVAPRRPKDRHAALDYDELTFFRYPGESTAATVALPPRPSEPSVEELTVKDSDEPLFVFRLEPAERRKHRLPGRFEVYKQGKETWVVMSASTRAVLGEWPQVVALGADDEELAANATFEVSEDGSGRWRLPMVPPGLELYRGSGDDKKWVRAWNTEIR